MTEKFFRRYLSDRKYTGKVLYCSHYWNIAMTFQSGNIIHYQTQGSEWHNKLLPSSKEPSKLLHRDSWPASWWLDEWSNVPR